MSLEFSVMRPAPLFKTPAISRFSGWARSRFAFRRETRGIAARLGRMARREGHAADADAALLRASSRGGSEGDPTRSARKRPPPIKIETPLGTPPFLTSHRCRARAWTHVFSLALDRRGPKPATVVAARNYKCGDRLRSERFRSAPRTSRLCRGSLGVPHRLLSWEVSP